MTKRWIKPFIVTTIAMSAMLSAPLAGAQEYPSKPITIVVPFAAGSGTDQTARLYGQAVAAQLKVPVVVENKGGANGFIAAQYVAKAAPDGYTVWGLRSKHVLFTC